MIVIFEDQTKLTIGVAGNHIAFLSGSDGFAPVEDAALVVRICGVIIRKDELRKFFIHINYVRNHGRYKGRRYRCASVSVGNQIVYAVLHADASTVSKVCVHVVVGIQIIQSGYRILLQGNPVVSATGYVGDGFGIQLNRAYFNGLNIGTATIVRNHRAEFKHHSDGSTGLHVRRSCPILTVSAKVLEASDHLVSSGVIRAEIEVQHGGSRYPVGISRVYRTTIIQVSHSVLHCSQSKSHDGVAIEVAGYIGSKTDDLLRGAVRIHSVRNLSNSPTGRISRVGDIKHAGTHAVHGNVFQIDLLIGRPGSIGIQRNADFRTGAGEAIHQRLIAGRRCSACSYPQLVVIGGNFLVNFDIPSVGNLSGNLSVIKEDVDSFAIIIGVPNALDVRRNHPFGHILVGIDIDGIGGQGAANQTLSKSILGGA